MSGGFAPAGYVDLHTYVRQVSAKTAGGLLADGTVGAIRINKVGDLKTIPPEFWRRTEGTLAMLNGVVRYEDSRVPGCWWEDRVFVKPATQVRGAGGRPPKWDWEGAIIELARLDAMEGTENKKPADLAKHLHSWFTINTGDAPADSEIRSRVKRFREALKT